MELHREFVHNGKFEGARLVLRFLNNGKIKLYLNDADWNVECSLEKIGCCICYNRNGIYSTAILKASKHNYV
jgi:hypothetical protein